MNVYEQNWYIPSKNGWSSKSHLSEITNTSSSNTSSSTTTYKVTAKPTLRVRIGPGTSYAIKTTVSYNTTVSISKTSGGWAYAPLYVGWMSLSYLKKT